MCIMKLLWKDFEICSLHFCLNNKILITEKDLMENKIWIFYQIYVILLVKYLHALKRFI